MDCRGPIDHHGVMVDHPMSATADHTEQVCASFGSGDARLNEVMRAAVRHLHAFAEEVQLTREEWMAGIRFLTSVGHASDEVRQEFILLSDTLGLSMLIEMLQAPPAPGVTESTVLGPFYVDDGPDYANGDSIVAAPETGGEALTVRGTVSDTAGRPVAGATVEVWQVQPNGHYDVEDDSAKRNLRATLRTADDGSFSFTTVRPIDYTVPADGPVGAMLAASGRHPWRPAHIHFALTAPGYQPLVTHLFDSTSPYLDSDTVFAVRPSLVVDMAGPECKVEFVLQTSGA
ncbi:MAG: carboxypeptidase regulatory-like domain-containing protein [Acidimicrobiaceae bacterium]|nr:carboxypeptidase regulatory-like domain-containing protein [Acidimicrobiaceae bacterium]